MEVVAGGAVVVVEINQSLHRMKLKIYLDTSILSAYFDERTPEQRAQVNQINIGCGLPSIEIVAPPEL